MVRRIKKKAGENLEPANIQKVYSLLNPETGSAISKKEACGILNITYNTTRLERIVQDWLEHKEYVKKRKAMNRGKVATNPEIAEAVTSYLQGDSIMDISKSLYRSSAFIKNIINTVGVPSKPVNKEEKSIPAFLPEQCVSDSFKAGDLVWSAIHHCLVQIRDEVSVDFQAEKAGFTDVNYEDKYGSKCYAIWVLENIDQDKDFWINGVETGGYNAYALAYDLGSLEHLKDYGVDLSRV